MRIHPKALLILPLLLALTAIPGMAQGSETAPVMQSVRDGVFTVEQAEKGAQVFEQTCQRCHQPEQFTGAGFIDAWAGQNADVLFDLIRTTMPEDNPSSLKKREYAAVLAFLFKLNGIPAGEADLPSTTRKLKQIRIEAPLATKQNP